jgi:hypothetical protein
MVNRCLAFITTSMVVLGEKLCGRPTDRPAGMLGIISGVLFLESGRVRPTLLSQCERLPHTGTAYGKHTYGVRGPDQEAYVSCVSSFPCRVYIDSNHHDSQMLVTTCLW